MATRRCSERRSGGSPTRSIGTEIGRSAANGRLRTRLERGEESPKPTSERLLLDLASARFAILSTLQTASMEAARRT